MEGTLVKVGMKVVLLQLFKNGANVFSIFFNCWEIDKDVIHINNAELFRIFMKDWVDKCLKWSEGVGQLEWYDTILEVAITGSERSLSFVSEGNTNLVKEQEQINFSEVLQLAESVKGFIDQG